MQCLCLELHSGKQLLTVDAKVEVKFFLSVDRCINTRLDAKVSGLSLIRFPLFSEPDVQVTEYILRHSTPKVVIVDTEFSPIVSEVNLNVSLIFLLT